MTKIEIINRNKAIFKKVQEEAKNMEGIKKLVAETLVLTWAKGNNFLGGLSDNQMSKIYFKVFEPIGYTFEEVYEEFERQIEKY